MRCRLNASTTSLSGGELTSKALGRILVMYVFTIALPFGSIPRVSNMTVANDTRSLWTGFVLITVVVVIGLVGVLLTASTNYSFRPIATPIAFTLLLLPVHALFYSVVATVRLRKAGDGSHRAVRRALMATGGSAGINLVAASALTLMAGGGFGWAGLALLYYLAVWGAGSLLVLPIVDFATGGRWMPRSTRR